MMLQVVVNEAGDEEVAVVVSFLGARIECNVGVVLCAIDQSGWLQLVDVTGQETVGTACSTTQRIGTAASLYWHHNISILA